MNSFWTSPSFNLLSILVAIVAIVFIGLKYGTSLKDKRLHLGYICGICIFLIVELATYICIQSDHSVEIVSYISFASTLSSLILSVVAIIYAIVSNNKGEVQYGKIDTASSKITDSVSEFSKKSEELTQGLSDVLTKLDEVKNISIAQLQLASAKLAICLKNSVFGFEKPSFLRGLRFSFFATFLMYRSEKSLKLDFFGMY